MKNYPIGVNYWDSTHGTDMWAKYDHDVIDADLAALAACGVNSLRIFPNWRDFQPVEALVEWRGNFKEYRLTGDRFPTNEYYIDEEMIAHFLDFCDTAEKYGMSLVVGVVTGWMSGRLFIPPVLTGKNIMADPECLKWQAKFCRGFVSMTKHHPAIIAWELGNECNCLGDPHNEAGAYLWTNTIRSAISLADPTRPVYSGMHSLASEENQMWTIYDQGELTDMLTCHPSPSPTGGGDVDPADTIRTTMIPTAQLMYYSALSGKPVMIEEQGTFSNMLTNREGAAKFLRVNILSGWANGSKGYYWWCGAEHLKLTQPPYSWSMIERELGLLDLERKPKPVGSEMKRVIDIIDTLPEIAPKEIDACCVLTRGVGHWPVAAASYILAKQAGLEMTMAAQHLIRMSADLPDAKVYFVPCVSGWASLNKEPFDALLERAAAGASVCFSIATGQLCTSEEFFGLTSLGMQNAGGETMKFNDGMTLPMLYGKKFTMEPLTAEVLARDSTGNVVFSRNRCGKGWVYYVGFQLENMLWGRPGVFTGENCLDYARIYREVGAEALAALPMRAANLQVGLTLHQNGDGWYAVAINYDGHVMDAKLDVSEGWEIRPVYGDMSAIEACGMAMVELVRA